MTRAGDCRDDGRAGGTDVPDPQLIIPLDRLPPGFAEQVEHPPPHAAPTRPAATAVLLRSGRDGPELLLLKRLRSAGFVPGAYVFPGGRVDDADADPELVRLIGSLPRGPDPAYWLAAIREVFEETGVLLAVAEDGSEFSVSPDARLAEWRSALLEHEASLLDVMRALRLRPDTGSMVYCSHWITPVAEPKRYDTRFFLARLPAGQQATIDEREMSHLTWLRPDEALRRFQAGELPMVFPTVKTIQRLTAWDSVEATLAAFAARDVPPILPRLVRTDEGIGIVLPDEET